MLSIVSDPLKVLLLAEYDGFGGTRTYFKQLLELYAHVGAKVTVLSTYEKQDQEIEALCQHYGFSFNKLSSIQIGDGIVRNVPRFRFLHERKIFKDYIKKMKFDIAVASVGTPELFLGALTLAPASLYILHTTPLPPRKYLFFFKRIIYLFFMRSYMNVMTVSRYAKRGIENAWGIKNVRVIYNTAGDVVKIHHQRSKKDSFRVLTLGHLVDYKDPFTWIEMALLLKRKMTDVDVHFTWLGDGPLIDRCRALVSSHQADPFIHFVGFSDDVEAYYLESDVYVQPSRIESLSLSVLDAMRHGLPCVVSDVGGLPELVVHGETGYVVQAGNAMAFADSLIRLAMDRELGAQFGLLATGRYVENFSKHRWADSIWILHMNCLRNQLTQLTKV